jgi:hypothetical protein
MPVQSAPHSTITLGAVAADEAVHYLLHPREELAEREQHRIAICQRRHDRVVPRRGEERLHLRSGQAVQAATLNDLGAWRQGTGHTRHDVVPR